MNILFRNAGKFFKRLSAADIALILILLMAAIARFLHYADTSYTSDELSAIFRLNFKTFRELVQNGFYVDGHPGGIQTFLWVWSQWFGYSEAALRFPFVIAGILAVYFAYQVASRMFGQVSGLFTAAALSFLQFPLMFSQIARPYISGLLFCLMMVFYWLRVVFGRNGNQADEKVRWGDYAGYIFSTALCMYNHYFSFLLAAIVGICGLFFLKKGKIMAYIASGLTAVLLFLPHLHITLNHLTYKGVGLWLGKPSSGRITEHLNYIFNDSWFMIVLFAITSILVSWKGRFHDKEKQMPLLAFLWFVLPFLIAYVYSLWVAPVLQNSVLIFSFPFLIMLLFIAGGDNFGRFQQALLIVFVSAGFFGTTVVSKFYRSQHFGEFRKVAEAAVKWEKETGEAKLSKAIVIFPNYIGYYFNRFGYQFRYEHFELKDSTEERRFDSLVNVPDKPFFLYAWVKPAPYTFEDRIRSRYPYILKSIHFGQFSGITLYGKEGGTEVEPGLKITRVYQDSVFCDIRAGQAADGKNSNGSRDFVYRMGRDAEFSPAIRKDLTGYKDAAAIRIQSQVMVMSKEQMKDLLLVVTLESPEGKAVKWESIDPGQFAGAGTWHMLTHRMDIKGDECRNSGLKVYIWNKGKNSVDLKKFKVTIYNVDNYSRTLGSQEVWGDTNEVGS